MKSRKNTNVKSGIAQSGEPGPRRSPNLNTRNLQHPASWTHLPVLANVFDFLDDPKDLAACAAVCRAWRSEADRDHRWRRAWGDRVSEQGLWRWASAEGGYREQLRAKTLVRKGEVAVRKTRQKRVFQDPFIDFLTVSMLNCFSQPTHPPKSQNPNPNFIKLAAMYLRRQLYRDYIPLQPSRWPRF